MSCQSCVHLPLFCHCRNVMSELCASDAGICVLKEREISGNYQPDWKSVGIINDNEDLVVVVIQVCCCVICINTDNSGVSSLYLLTLPRFIHASFKAVKRLMSPLEQTCLPVT